MIILSMNNVYSSNFFTKCMIIIKFETEQFHISLPVHPSSEQNLRAQKVMILIRAGIGQYLSRYHPQAHKFVWI